MESAGRESLSPGVITESPGNSWPEPLEGLNKETGIDQDYSNERASEGVQALLPEEEDSRIPFSPCPYLTPNPEGEGISSSVGMEKIEKTFPRNRIRD